MEESGGETRLTAGGSGARLRGSCRGCGWGGWAKAAHPICGSSPGVQSHGQRCTRISTELQRPARAGRHAPPATGGWKAPDEKLRIASSRGFLSSKMFCCLIYDFFCNAGAWDKKAEGFLLFSSANSLSLPQLCKFFSRMKVVAESGLPLSCFIMLLTRTLNPAFLCCMLKVTAAV